jgi:hypothetical protein
MTEIKCEICEMGEMKCEIKCEMRFRMQNDKRQIDRNAMRSEMECICVFDVKSDCRPFKKTGVTLCLLLSLCVNVYLKNFCCMLIFRPLYLDIFKAFSSSL